MNPLLAAGVLAAAHKLGIMPDSPIVAGILGYLAGQHQDAPRDQERALQAELAASRHRELLLQQALRQQHHDAQLRAVLEAAKAASGR